MLNLDINSIPVQLLTGTVMVPVCSKKVWGYIKQYDDSDEAAHKICGMLLHGIPLNLCDQRILIQQYSDCLTAIRKQLKFEIPYYPAKKEQDDLKYTIYTCGEKLVADYAGLNLYEIDKISILEYWLLERDAFIYSYSRTEKGREYLNNAYRLEQVEADEDLGGI